jgi:hypothetical protein
MNHLSTSVRYLGLRTIVRFLGRGGFVLVLVAIATGAEPADITLSDGSVLRAAIVIELTATDAVIKNQSGESRVSLESVPLEVLGRARLEQNAREVARPIQSSPPSTPPSTGEKLIRWRTEIGAGAIAALAGISLFLWRDRRRLKAFELQLQTELAKIRTRFASVIDIDAELEHAKTQLGEMTRAIHAQQVNLAGLKTEEATLSSEILKFREDLECYDHGLYEPVFAFDISQKYKDAIEAVRDQQKAMIKDGTAAFCSTQWTVNGSASEGKKQTKHYVRLMLRAFNGEAEGIIADVRWNNVSRMIDRLEAAFIAINKLGETHQTSINREYWQLKLRELRLTHEHTEKVQAEKEEQRRIAEQIREEERAQREIEQALREAEDDERKYQQALVRAREDLQRAQGEQVSKMERQITLLEERLREAEQNKQRAISRAQLTKSGHVYIISNIGSFGDGMFKIGMTRRLEPLERVRELGDASVPFEFDVHAMVYTEDAPALENLLHSKFGHQRVNLVNDRKEFFNVTIEELDAVLTANGYKVELIKIPEAKAFRQTNAMRTRGQYTPEPRHVAMFTRDGRAQVVIPSGSALGESSRRQMES